MGWASGSELLDGVAKAVMPMIDKPFRGVIAGKLIELFEDADCDTIYECTQPDIKREYKRLNLSDID